MPDPTQKTCFVIMPYGNKTDAGGNVIDFDNIYNNLIRDAVEEAGLACIRCDEIDEAGWIHKKMFSQIFEADVAVVDISTLNPNVFYELGVRHALAESVTVLLRRKGTTLPFNIEGIQVIEYDETNMASVKDVKRKIGQYIRNGLRPNRKDSPVHEALSLMISSERKKLDRTAEFPYKLIKVPGKIIGLLTGDLHNAGDIADVWVNSENTNMEMGRHFDRSISSVIRYMGAKKDATGHVVQDTVADELGAIVRRPANIAPGTVIVTGSGEIEQTHGVKKIFHVASVVGQFGVGYAPIPDVGTCVRSCLKKAAAQEFQNLHIKSILFPLIGCGTARGNLEQLAPRLLWAAIAYLEENPKCELEKVYFLTWTDRELAVCRRILDEAHELEFAP
jgi:O-acetyl-ADP-ribose deacetylase (regulator of RNase III)